MTSRCRVEYYFKYQSVDPTSTPEVNLFQVEYVLRIDFCFMGFFPMKLTGLIMIISLPLFIWQNWGEITIRFYTWMSIIR